MLNLSNLDEAVAGSLKTLYQDVSLTSWYGREREIVSLYVFGHLLPLCFKSSVLFDATQIGIEVAVPQVKVELSQKQKAVVCKDVVIWSRPKMTCWNVENNSHQYPLSVLEWKSVNKTDGGTQKRAKLGEFYSDVEWLRQTSQLTTEFVGYAILVTQNEQKPRLECSRISQGSVEHKWFFL